MSWQRPGDTVNVSAYEFDGATSNYTYRVFAGITLKSKYEYYEKYAPNSNRDEYRSVAFMGVTTGYLGALYVDAANILAPSATPFAGANSADDYFILGLRFLTLPILGLSPIDSPMSDLYAPTGPLSSIPAPVFWVLANSMYWVFWISIMVALTNVLPVTVFDGGQVFRDILDRIVERTKIKDKEKAVGAVMAFFTILVIALIFWQLIGPRL
jgi:hypothetical protein